MIRLRRLGRGGRGRTVVRIGVSLTRLVIWWMSISSPKTGQPPKPASRVPQSACCQSPLERNEWRARQQLPPSLKGEGSGKGVEPQAPLVFPVLGRCLAVLGTGTGPSFKAKKEANRGVPSLERGLGQRSAPPPLEQFTASQAAYDRSGTVAAEARVVFLG